DLAADEAPLRIAYVRGSIHAENLVRGRRGKGLGTAAAVAENSGLFNNIERVELSSEREFFESEPPIADLLVTNAEKGAAWTLKYPRYAVARPTGLAARTPLCYFVAEKSRFEEFLNSWLKLKRLNGTVQQVHDYWILGVEPNTEAPRWSIIRDVLHWVD
ncbi:MAG: hypothetical protein N2C14_12230, partial [Planctomycetales bacterium]